MATRPEVTGEVRPLDDHGPPRRGRVRARAGIGLLWLIPAAIFVGVVVAQPTVTIVRDSFVDEGPRAGFSNYLSALTDQQLRIAVVNTAVWAVVVPLLVAIIGYALALLTRDIDRKYVTALAVIPMAMPLVVTGVAFRILYDPSPRLGPATALLETVAGRLGIDSSRLPPLLGDELVTASLISAFLWAYVGLATVMFRAALEQIPPGLEDVARAEGADSWRVLRDVQWPFLRRTAAIVVILLAVMASRTFDLVLVMAPGSVQHIAEVLGLYVLRQPDVEAAGEATAVGVVWLIVVAAGVVLSVRRVRHDWPSPDPPSPDQPSPVAETRRPRSRPTTPSRRRPRIRPAPRWRHLRVRRSRRTSDLVDGWREPSGIVRPPGRGRTRAWVLRRVILWCAVALWAFPIVVLVLVSSYRPIDPATRGWLAVPTGTSYAKLWASGILDTLGPSAVLGLVVTVAVLVVSVLAAYSLAWLNPCGSAAATAVLLVAAVVPIQVVARPLHDVLAPIEGQGTALVLALVHVGRGVPLAVLVLRNAFSAIAAERIIQARVSGHNEFAVLTRIVMPAARPALVAVAAWEFILVWNDLVVGFVLGGPGFTPVMMALFGESRQFTTSAGLLAAGAVIASIPPVLIALLARKSLVRGLISGVVSR